MKGAPFYNAFTGRAPPSGALRQLDHIRSQGFHRPGEHHLICLAEIVEIVEVPPPSVTELGTSAVADRLIFTNLALRMCDRLFGGKAIALTLPRNLGPRI